MEVNSVVHKTSKLAEMKWKQIKGWTDKEKKATLGSPGITAADGKMRCTPGKTAHICNVFK